MVRPRESAGTPKVLPGRVDCRDDGRNAFQIGKHRAVGAVISTFDCTSAPWVGSSLVAQVLDCYIQWHGAQTLSEGNLMRAGIDQNASVSFDV